MIDPETERGILTRLRGGRRARTRAIGDLFEALREPLFGLTLRMTGRPDLADDAVQEAFLDVMRGWESFRGESRLSTWVFRIAVRAALRVAARAATRSEVVPEELRDGSAGPSETLAQADSAARVLHAIAELPPGQRAVVSLMALEELSQVEVAEVLGLPAGTVYSRLHEARAGLRERLQQST